MRTLDEQIEYMESEVDWYQAKVDRGKGWEDSLELCEAILKTLERARDEQQAKKCQTFSPK